MLQLSDIKRITVRLEHIKFMRQFDELLNDIKPEIVSVTAACQDLTNSNKFVLLFYILQDYQKTCDLILYAK